MVLERPRNVECNTLGIVRYHWQYKLWPALTGRAYPGCALANHATVKRTGCKGTLYIFYLIHTLNTVVICVLENLHSLQILLAFFSPSTCT